jgi:uncharacterized membrane protein
MKTGRLEAFSDGVLAIVITIMVLELKAPQEVTLQALSHEWPIFASYLFSFIYIGIYWNNHHHLFQITEKVNGKILWANLHLLFWLSLIPFTTSWLGENYTSALPVALYGFNLLMCAIAYFTLQGSILRLHGADFILKKQIGKDWKGKLSLLFYIIGLTLSFVSTWIAIGFYVLVAVMWIVPDKRIERHIS